MYIMIMIMIVIMMMMMMMMTTIIIMISIIIIMIIILSHNCSKFSKELKCITSAGAPSAPSSPKLDKAGVNFINLSWSKPESKGAEISEYLLEMEDGTTVSDRSVGQTSEV